jgi:catechol 2,3-dioxygenase-like lactoylglutathione lyase family enzyme
MSDIPPDGAQQIEVPVPEIDRDIYAMPAFATLRTRDLEASRRWYVEGLGFIVLAEIPGPTGDVALIHLRRWRYQDILLVPAAAGSAPATTGFRLTFSAHGADLDALAAQARAVGGGAVEGPLATPWNTRDVITRDPNGFEVVFTTVLEESQRDQAFSRRMDDVRQRMGLSPDAAPR